MNERKSIDAIRVDSSESEALSDILNKNKKESIQHLCKIDTIENEEESKSKKIKFCLIL